MAGWKDIVGHNDVIKYMEKTVASETPSHAYIISGASGSGKTLLSKTFAMALQCKGEDVKPCMKCPSCKKAMTNNHPDIIFVHHEKPRTISVDEIREQLVDDMGIKPYIGPYKIYIVEEAEKMTEQAQNALLKTLEEPPEYGIILLTTVNPDALLSTIQSRCVLLKLRNLRDPIIMKYLEDIMGVDEEKAALCTAFAQGSLGKAIRLAESSHFYDIRMDAVRLLTHIDDMNTPEVIEEIKQISTYKLEFDDYLDIIAVWYRDVLMLKATNDVNNVIFQDQLRFLKEKAKKSSYEGIETILEALKKARERLKANVNFELIIELLLLTVKEN